MLRPFFEYDAFTSSGLRHGARPAMPSQASYCDRANLIPFWPAWLARYLSTNPVPMTIIRPRCHRIPKIGRPAKMAKHRGCDLAACIGKSAAFGANGVFRGG